MNPIEQFESERAERIVSLADDAVFVTLSRDWLQASMQRKYVYNFEWMGLVRRPSRERQDCSA